MRSLKKKDRYFPSYISVILPQFFLFLLFVFELREILEINLSKFTYTLDDPYIHLALAENIFKWHYGINLNEISAPSSSILWPFLLAPFSQFSFFEFIPLAINIISASATLIFLRKILLLVVNAHYNLKNEILITFILSLMIPSLNLIGLIFTGMEHSLQVLTVVIVLYGIINEIKNNILTPLTLVAIVLAPLVRYENFLISLSAIGYFLFTGYRKNVILSFSILIIITISFSIFLKISGLDFLPTSVLAKSRIAMEGVGQSILISNFKNNIKNAGSIFLWILMTFNIASSLNQKLLKKERIFAFFISAAIIAHFFLGQFGWFYRYEIYIWSAAIISTLYLYKNILQFNFYKIILLFLISSLFVVKHYSRPIITTPAGASNIFEQHYQMHKFLIKYYKKPAAVNDIGYVSYRNKNYILDLWGLASIEALKERDENDASWISFLCSRYNIKFAMIYDKWFRIIPENWDKVAELHLKHRQASAGGDVVSFYSLDKSEKKSITILLNKFRETLPEGIKLVLLE